jgi:carbon-monoxide dehydrogenase large subunit
MATEAYRGAGRPEAAYIIERVMDAVANRLELDPIDLRRRNFIPRESFPYTTASGSIYDSGDYDKPLDRAVEMFDYRGSRKAQREARKSGRLVGIGVATFTEVCGIGPSGGTSPLQRMGTWESATVRVEPSGNVTVLTGISPHGQGEETAFAQMVADAFGVEVTDVTVVHGDTDVVQHGVGTFGSRGIAVGGAALHIALERVHAKAQRIAAHHLDVPPEKIEFDAGVFSVAGATEGESRSLTFREIAEMAHLWNVNVPGEEPGLEAVARFEPSGTTYPFGAHLCQVEIDRETGKVELQRYIAVDDFGNVINPLLADGQRIGGIVQGIGQALWEEVHYGDDGQLISGTLMDYSLPRAKAFPRFELDNTVTPTPINPLGAKGIGELGTIGSTPCVMNAVLDALSPLGIDHLDMPARADRVWAAIQQADKQS